MLFSRNLLKTKKVQALFLGLWINISCIELAGGMNFFSETLLIIASLATIQSKIDLFFNEPLMKILIRNLDRSTTEEEIKTLFLQYGNVQYCNLVCDKDNGGSKGFAFVEMPKPGDAKAAIKNLNNKQVGSQKIRVKKTENNTP